WGRRLQANFNLFSKTRLANMANAREFSKKRERFRADVRMMEHGRAPSRQLSRTVHEASGRGTGVPLSADAGLISPLLAPRFLPRSPTPGQQRIAPMSFNPTRKRLDHGSRSDRRPAGLTAVIAITTIAGVLMVPGRVGLAQEGKAQGAEEAKLGLGDLIKQANQSVVLIQIENKSGQKVGFGSGFLIDKKGLVATNLHVVQRAAKASVVFGFKAEN